MIGGFEFYTPPDHVIISLIRMVNRNIYIEAYEIEARISFFTIRIYPLLHLHKVLEPADFEYCPQVLKDADDYPEGLWLRLMEAYDHYKKKTEENA